MAGTSPRDLRAIRYGLTVRLVYLLVGLAALLFVVGGVGTIAAFVAHLGPGVRRQAAQRVDSIRDLAAAARPGRPGAPARPGGTAGRA